MVWTDPQSGRHGFAVIDTLVNGIAGGGTRLRQGCSLEEVERLARTMTLKTAALGVPAGGSKCGLDCDPHDPEARPLLIRFVRALKPLFDTCLNTGEDLGTSQDLLAEVFAAAGAGEPLGAAVRRSGDPEAARQRLARGQANVVEGIPLVDLVGGFGVAEAAAVAMQRLGWLPADTAASIQGFGSMGGSSARYLARLGVRVVAVADAQGVVADPAGLDVEGMLARRNGLGEIDRAQLPPGTARLDLANWQQIECDLLVPAAVADAVNEANAARLPCRLVVEAANLPTTEAAEAILAQRGIPVVPDFVANAGTGAWLWWLVLGQIEPTPEAAFERISGSIRTAVERIFDLRPDGLGLRQAALELATSNLERLRLGG